jgi:hypothetical protein
MRGALKLLSQELCRKAGTHTGARLHAEGRESMLKSSSRDTSHANLLVQLALMLALAVPALADPALNPEVTQATINDTICAPGYSNVVRPSWYESAKLKRQLLEARGETWDDAPKYQLDHIIPLCLGGSATDPSNLQLEPSDEAYRKDRVEIQAMRCVCAGKVTLAEAQHDLVTDWQAAYHKYAVMVCRRPAQ